MPTKTKSKKQKKWLRFRHKVVRSLLGWTLGVYTRFKYGLKVDKFRDPQKRPMLILFNHQTAFDQFFVGLAFKQPVYYVASEDLFSNGWVSSLIRYLVAPIPIRKQTTDITAVMNCIRVAREGGTIAIAPEGNRTFSGKIVYMSDAIAPLAKKMKLSIALFRIEGGFGVQPRWSDGTRKGKMRAYVSSVIEPEEYAAMTNEELFEKIREGLNVDEVVADGPFKSKKKAEYLERVAYICPDCGLSEFESHGNDITCKTCGKVITYNEDKTLTGKGFDFPFRFFYDWYAYQERFINQLDVLQLTDKPIYQEQVQLSEVIVYKKKLLLRKDTQLRLYGDRLVFDGDTENALTLNFADTSVITILGRNKLNIYHGKTIYQIKGCKRFNAMKYMHIFCRYKNMIKGDSHAEFLGL